MSRENHGKPSARAQKTLISGYGKAGRGLHFCCLRKLSSRLADDPDSPFCGQVGIVDPGFERRPEGLPADVPWLPSIADVKDFEPAETVVHVCACPPQHLEAASEAALAGYRKLIIEKPLVTTPAELEGIWSLQRQFGVDLVVVAPWLSVELTRRLKEMIDTQQLGRLNHIRMEQSKTRIDRALDGNGHATAFEIEMPHMLSLATWLAGPVERVLDATCGPVVAAKRVVLDKGNARLLVEHGGGRSTHLGSDLQSPVRVRRIELRFDDGLVEGHYPVSRDDHTSRLRVFRGDRREADELLHDEPLAASLLEYYRYFQGTGPRPASDLAFNHAVLEVLFQAKRRCGLLPPGDPPITTPLHADRRASRFPLRRLQVVSDRRKEA